MRITNRVLSKGYLTDLNRNLQNLKKYQEQLSSGKEIRRPSDDPFKVARSMELYTSLRSNERYQENIDEALGWLETTDSALKEFNDTLQRIRELTVQGGNGTLSSTDRDAIVMEMKQLKEHLMDIGNTSYDGRYIFGGDETTKKPFTNNSGTIQYNFDVNGLLKEFASGIVLDISTTSKELTNQSGSSDVFTEIQNIIDDLSNGDSPSDRLDELDGYIDNTLRLRGKVGAICNRLESMSSKNEEENYNMTELLSKTEDIDIAEKVMEYSVLESVYTASLQTGAKILQPSLLDFLR